MDKKNNLLNKVLIILQRIFYIFFFEKVLHIKLSPIRGVKSAKLAISKVALLTQCMEFEFSGDQIPLFEVL